MVKKMIIVSVITMLFIAMLLCSISFAEGTEATISKQLWADNVNDNRYWSSSPLRAAQTFSKNTTYSTVEDLPDSKIKIDDGTTACSIYFWKDGNNCYWWSDADVVYMPADASYMFYRCSGFTSLDVSDLNTGNVIRMDMMFYECRNLASLDVTGFDTSNVTNMRYMFYSCSGLTSLDVSGWATSNVTDMDSMFSGCSNLTSLNVTGFDTRSVTNMSNVFYNCQNLTSLNLSSWDMRNVAKAHYMFSYCSMETLNLSGWQWGEAADLYYIFDHGNFKVLDISGWDTSKVASFQGMFYKCVLECDLDLSQWDVSKVTSLYYMFQDCTIPKVNLCGWQLDSLTGATYVFYGSKIDFLDVRDWNFLKATDLRYLVDNSTFGTILITGWHLPKLRWGYGLLQRINVKELDVTGWVLNDAIDSLTNLFYDSPNLEVLNLFDWDLNTLIGTSESLWNWFDGCNSLRQVQLGTEWTFNGVNRNGNSSSIGSLPSNSFTKDGISYTGRWIHVNGKYGPYYGGALPTVYTGSMYGTWVREEVSNNCYVRFQSTLNGTRGFMDQVIYDCTSEFQLPVNDFRKEGYAFVSWDDGKGNRYADEDVIPAGRYSGNEIVTLTAVWTNKYTINFVSSEPDVTGTMEQVSVEATTDYTLPSNQFIYGDVPFVCWADDRGHAYSDGASIPANTYAPGDEVTFMAMFVEPRYTIQFQSELTDVIGDMPTISFVYNYDYVLPECHYHTIGSVFDHWEDDAGNTYAVSDVIPGGTHAPGDVLTLTARFTKLHYPLDMNNGEFTFSIKSGETAVFDPIPANTGYQVYEQVPDGWILVQRVNASGTIEALNDFEAIFLNKHDPEKVKVQFNGLKLIDGAPAEAGSFTFELWGEDGYIQSVEVGDTGLIQFDPIEFMKEDIGEHHYVIKERIGENDTIVYDGHEENIVVTIAQVGSIVYAHTDNIDDDGNKLSDYVSNQRYSKIITIPGAESLHVRLKYTNVRGPFYIWAGEHNEVLTESFSASCNTSMQSTSNPGGYYRYFPYQSGKDQEYLYDEFDIPGDSLSIWYYSYAYPESQGYYPNGPYSDMVNYGYYMAIGDGYLAAAMDVDDDGIEFENTSKPGKLVLQKLGTDNDVHEGTFYYEVQFFTANGMTYELPDSIITYEQRDGLSQDFPDLDVPDNPAYKLCVNEIKLFADGSSVVTTERYQYKAGSVYSISEVPGFIVSAIEGGDVVQTQSGWQGMLAEDTEVNVYYSEPTTVSGSVVWKDGNNIDGKRPDSVTVHLIRDDVSIDYVTVSEDDNWEFSFENLPFLDRSGNVIAYSVMMEDDWQDDDPYYTITHDGYNIIVTSHGSMRIMDVTLLSKEECTEFRDNIPLTSNGWWWTRSPGYDQHNAAMVFHDGSIGNYYVSDDSGLFNAYARPALICDLGASNLNVGDKILLADHNWTVISTSVNITDDPYNGKAIILCDDLVEQMYFRSDVDAADANVYAVSDIKVWLENWATENEIMPEPDVPITDVTLLSKEEYTEFKDNIPLNANGVWWTRSSGNYQRNAADVNFDGSLRNDDVSDLDCCVRPALICDLSSSNLGVENKISLAGYNWTVISTSVNITDDPYNGKAIILCDDFVGQTAFSLDRDATDANIYDVSDVKVWLATWVDEHPFWSKTVTVSVVE